MILQFFFFSNFGNSLGVREFLHLGQGFQHLHDALGPQERSDFEEIKRYAALRSRTPCMGEAMSKEFKRELG